MTVSTSFEVVDSNDQTVGALRFRTRPAARDHAQDMLASGIAGPLFVAQVIERTTREVGRRRPVVRFIDGRTLNLFRKRIGR